MGVCRVLQGDGLVLGRWRGEDLSSLLGGSWLFEMRPCMDSSWLDADPRPRHLATTKAIMIYLRIACIFIPVLF